MLTILWYSAFTFLSAFVTGVWQLAILRLLAGIGIGGEWAMGGTFVAEEWPEHRRRVGAGLMHTGYYVGIFLAALANYGIGSRFGWRAMFIVGGLPALLLAWVRLGVTEPAAWTKKEKVVRAWAVWRPLATLFSPVWRLRTIVNSLLMLVSICGLWAGTVYVPLRLQRSLKPVDAAALKLPNWPLGESCWSRSRRFLAAWRCRALPNGWDAAGRWLFSLLS
jgi:MFS family permease